MSRVMKRITIVLDEKTLACARAHAAQRGASVSGLIAEMLAEAHAYDEAMRRFLAKPPVRLRRRGERFPARHALHDRVRSR